MNWRTKALAQQVFSRLPFGGHLNLLMQIKVTKTLPASSAAFAEMTASAEGHLSAVCTALGVDDPGSLRGYEFGAGWHLGVAVGLAGLGVGEQTLVDREALAHPNLVRYTIDELCRRYPDSSRLQDASGADDLATALDGLGITYRAPVDARATGLPEGTFDFMTSTSTLEHIPASDLDDLLLECNRILRPGGVFSAMIDYGDHYAGFDRSITRLNFLRYSPRRWRLYSPPLQYQNRLRHSDYVAHVERAGFTLVEVSTLPVQAQASSWVRHTSVDPSFRHYDLDDLVIGDSHIVAVKT